MGLRERKKARTHRAIEDAALALFGARGYEHVTIAEIADAADVAPRTFFSYFPSKESVLFPDFEATFERLVARLGEREPSLSTMDVLRAWIVDLVEHPEPRGEREAARRAIIDVHEPLLAYERTLASRFEGVLAEALAEELADAPTGRRPRLVAAATAAAFVALRPAPNEPADSAADQLAALEDTMSFLRGGIDALATRDPV